jgi:hypothetical protein
MLLGTSLSICLLSLLLKVETFVRIHRSPMLVLKLVVNAVWVQTFLVEALRIHAVNSGILS